MPYNRSLLDFAVPVIVHEVWTYTFAAISLAANALLFFAINSVKNKFIGKYRYLLIIFGISDIGVTLIHVYGLPGMHITSFGYIFFSHRFVDAAEIWSVIPCYLFILIFFESFPLLAFHFVYRYVTFCRPAWLDWTSRAPKFIWGCIAASGNFIYMFLVLLSCSHYYPNDQTREMFRPMMLEVYDVDLVEPIHKGYMAIAYRYTTASGEVAWIWKTVAAVITIFVAITATASVIAACTVKIQSALRSSSADTPHLSLATRSLQRQLFRALLVQTAVPCIFSYLPCACILIFPFFELNIGGIGSVLVMFLSVFAAVDPVFIILFITSYRRSIASKFKRFLGSPSSIYPAYVSAHSSNR